MPGQSIEIHGHNLAAAVEVTDKSWYLSEFGFYYQPYSATITVGSYECKLAFHNDTLIKCNAVYGDMYVPHELEVSILGKGRALSQANGVAGAAKLNFTFALYVYDISPSVGSLAGGTEVTFTTSSLTSGADLGVATYDVHFVEDESQAISNYVAQYLGLEQGANCAIKATGEYYVTCVTSAVSGSQRRQGRRNLVRDRQRRCLECHRRAARCVACRRVELAGDLLALHARKQQQRRRQLCVFVREAPHSCCG